MINLFKLLSNWCNLPLSHIVLVGELKQFMLESVYLKLCWRLLLVTINALYIVALHIPWFYDSVICKTSVPTLLIGIKYEKIASCTVYVFMVYCGFMCFMCTVLSSCVYVIAIVCVNMNNYVHIVKVQKDL